MAAARDLFVGRSRELESLRDALDRAVEGHGQVIMVAGEPGIGKTRILQELATHAATQGVTVLWGQCLEEAGAPPYWPWVQILRRALRTAEPATLLRELGAGASDLADIVPEIRDLAPELEPSVGLEDAAQARFRMFDSIRQFIAVLSRHQAALIVLEDLHWADVPSLRLLEFLASALADSRLLLVGSYRPTELSRQHPLSDSLGGLARATHVARLNLGGLSADEVHHFVAAATKTWPPDWLAKSLYVQTEGNPLFLREIVRFLEHQGVFSAGRDAPLTALPPAIRIPEGITEVIGRRLNLLSAGCNHMLALASVIGRRFSHDLLMRSAVRQGEPGLIDGLDEALGAHVIEETSEGQYQFAHNLIRMTLYDELRPARRRQLHRIVGGSLEASRRVDMETVLPELARHFLAAGDVDRAAEYATRAGRRAEALLAFEDAAEFFQAALESIEQADDPDETARCRLLFDLGEALWKASAYPRALERLRETTELAAALGEAELCARAAITYEQVAWRNAHKIDPSPRSLLERALHHLGGADTAIRIQTMATLARALLYDGAAAEARRQGERALAMARQFGDPRVLATCLYCVLDLVGEGQNDHLLLYATEALAAARQIGNLELIHVAHSWRFLAFMEPGDTAQAEAELESISRIDVQLRQRTYLVAVLFNRIMLALMRGELAESERLIVGSMAMLRDRGMAAHEEQLSVLIFSLRREQGRLAELRPMLSVFLQQSAAMGVWQPGLALLYAEVDEPDAARKIFELVAEKGFAAIPRDGRWILCMVYLAEICAAIGDHARAVELYDLMLPYAGRFLLGGRLVCFGSADRYLGQLCATMSRWSEAERHFGVALAMNGRIGAFALLAHTMHDYAVMLLSGNAPRNRPRAITLLRGCLERARQLGLRGLERRAASRLAPFADAPASAASDELTAREADVLRLIAIGRSNADIATALEISLNTVATHVRNILAKTGCANRTEAAAYAMRQGPKGVLG